jgi:hypothetical protein
MEIFTLLCAEVQEMGKHCKHMSNLGCSAFLPKKSQSTQFLSISNFVGVETKGVLCLIA